MRVLQLNDWNVEADGQTFGGKLWPSTITIYKENKWQHKERQNCEAVIYLDNGTHSIRELISLLECLV